MIIEKRVKDFEALGFGMFVHFGLYSVLGKGEWIQNLGNVPSDEYAKLTEQFSPKEDWAERLVRTAKAAGCKYITLTTRHHDGFSLYDTCGLNDFDAPHSLCGRDLVREFVDACNAQGIIPFFYHTLLDWKVESYKNDFKEYLVYLRKSVEIICKNYGKIGGIWFDGMWDRRNDDWEEDALYSMIRSYQPDAMIINNTGLSERGALGHIELDSVTFERGRPEPINSADSPKYIASEMCQVFTDHWGYAKNDFHFKSLVQIIEDLCICRRYGSNYLLNVGPMPDGYIRPLDEAMLLTLGEWVKIYGEAIYNVRPSNVDVIGKERDFILKGDRAYYLFCHDMTMVGDPNVAIDISKKYVDRFTLGKTVRSVKWLDNGENVEFSTSDGQTTVAPGSFAYGTNLVVRVAKIEVED